MALTAQITDLISQMNGNQLSRDISRATSPGAEWKDSNGLTNGQDAEKLDRARPRTFPYSKHLPYEVEEHGEREKNLEQCIQQLYVAVSAGDFAPGAVHWTREIRAWLYLKFDLPKQTRIDLVKLYYELSLAPGIDYLIAERFTSMFMVLTK